MLEEIICEYFSETKMSFNAGLNVVLGDDLATNSIGKSMTLMIIDFVFGGNSYIEINHDTVDNLGNHSFKFKFKFENEYFYFIRSTENYKFVSICDENYVVKNEISLDEYKNLLKGKYKLENLSSTFRSIVGTYSRIWGKNNYNVDKPLKQSDSKMKDDVKNIIRLFERYISIENFEKQIDKINDRKQAFNKAENNDLIPSISITKYKQNNSEIEDLEKSIEKLTTNMKDFDLDVLAVSSDEVIELKEEKNKLFVKRNILNNKLKKIEKNLSDKDLKIKSKINEIVEFFPNINIEKLNSIDNFHKKIANNLKTELDDEKKIVESQLVIINEDIEKIDLEIKSKINVKDVPKYNLDKLVNFVSRMNSLKEANIMYEKKKEVQTEYENVKNDLLEIKSKITADIGNSINIKMHELFKKIYNDTRKSPVFSLTDDSYNLKRFDDTGTGSSYINLVAFDLSIFLLTQLPIIIHDSILFKNVQISAFENLVNIYNSFGKQSFISIDEINRFSTETVALLEEKSIVRLSETNTLFIKNWKIK